MVSGFTNNQTNSLGINGVQTVYEKLNQNNLEQHVFHIQVHT